MKEKIKNLDFKHILLVCALTLFIGFLVLCIVLLNNYDKDNMKKNFYSSDISYYDDNLNVYLNDSSYSCNNSLVFEPLNYYQEISMEDFAFNSNPLTEGYCDVGSFYISNRDLFYTYRNGFYLDDTEPNVYLNFSLSYRINKISSDFAFNVPLWVNYEGSYLSRSDLIDFLVYNSPSYFYSTSFIDNNDILVSVNYYIDITDYIRQYAYYQTTSQFEEKKIVFYILTRFADARYDSSDCEDDIFIDYQYHNLFNFNDYYRQNYILDGNNYNINSSFSCYMFDLSSGSYTLSGFNVGNYLNVSLTSSSGVVIDTLIQTNSRSEPFTFNLGSNSTIVICVDNSISPLIMFNSGSYSLPYQFYHIFDDLAFTDWCSSHHFYLSNFNNGNSLYYDSLNNRYNDLLNDYNSLNNDYNSLNSDYNSLNTNYTTLQEQYNSLANGEYSFSQLFWSISAVPFGVLTSAFNINVLGVNLALYNYGFIYCNVVNLVV